MTPTDRQRDERRADAPGSDPALAPLAEESFGEAIAAIAGEFDLEALLERIIEQAIRLTGAAGGAISLVGASPDAPRLLTATYRLPESLRGRSIPGSQGIMGQVLRACGPIIIERYETLDSPLPDQAFRAYSPWIGVPIWRTGQIIGTFGIGFGDPARRHGVAEVALLETLAHHASIALENALLYRESRALGIAEERNRLAREIHDTIAQTLATLRMELRTLSTHVDQVGIVDPRLGDGLQRIDTIAARALDEVRRSIWALQPAVLEGTTLADALRAALEPVDEAGIRGQVVVRGAPRDLDATVRSNLFLVAQEALNNARKHAAARTISVALEFREADVELTVQDDGAGFDSEALPEGQAASGFGLSVMRDRVRQLGGRISVVSALGVGTRVRAVVPYELPLGSIPRPSPAAAAPARPMHASGPRTRVVLIDDHALVRQGIRQVLGQDGGFEVVAEASDGEEGLGKIAETRPDIVLLDIQMPGMNGLETLRRTQKLADPPAVIMLTMALHDEVVFEAVRSGAKGYLVKDGDPADLLKAIRLVAAGGSVVAPSAAERLSERVSGAAQLTAREREILALVARGLRNKEIAAELAVSEKTVQFHLANLFGKLGVESRVEAVRAARERGFVLDDR